MKANKEKILFVIPSYSSKILDKYTKTNVIPYGVLSLASYLNHYVPDVYCEILDLNSIEVPEKAETILAQTLQRFDSDLVGLSLMYNACIEPVDRFARKIKGS